VFDVGVSDGLLSGTTDDTGGRTQLPARSKPRGHLTDGDRDGDGVGEGVGDEGGEVSWGVETACEFEEVAGSEEDGGDGLLLGVGVEGESVVEGGSDERVVGFGGSDVDGASVGEGLVGDV
jgi:hypothetical protein